MKNDGRIKLGNAEIENFPLKKKKRYLIVHQRHSTSTQMQEHNAHTYTHASVHMLYLYIQHRTSNTETFHETRQGSIEFNHSLKSNSKMTAQW